MGGHGQGFLTLIRTVVFHNLAVEYTHTQPMHIYYHDRYTHAHMHIRASHVHTYVHTLGKSWDLDYSQ